MNSIGLYIHIPFCRSKCNYCDFYSRCNLKNTDDYIDALCRLIECYDYSYDTVFFGGGTPSVLTEDTWKKIFSSLKGKIKSGAEVTAEANPCDITVRYSESLLRVGINRLSIGIQSLDDEILSYIGRKHTSEEAELSCRAAKEAGFSNISADFMLGLSGQTPSHIERALDFSGKYLTHISSYMLKVEENTAFFKKGLSHLSDDETAELYLKFVSDAEKRGFGQYEISNFAKPGFESRHNLKYWHCEEYLGLGPGAHSYISGKRFFTEPDTDMFIFNVKNRKDVFTGYEDAEPEKEKAMLGLRLREGIKISDFTKDFGYKMLNASEKYLPSGLVVSENSILRLSEKGFLVSNTIISDIVF